MMSVSIEPLAAEHADAVLALGNDPAISRTSSIPHPLERGHVDAWIVANDASPRTVLTSVIRVAGVVVGTVTLKKLDAADGSGELSFWIGTQHQGKGYAMAAARLACQLGFNQLLLSAIHAHFLVQANVASGKILSACGLQRDPDRADLPVADRFAEAFPGDNWRFVRCARPSETSLAEAAQEYQRLWNAYMTEYCGGRGSCVELAIELMRQMLAGPSLRILDLGCGTGSFIQSLQATTALPALSIVGVDGSGRNLAIASALVGSDARVTLHQRDLTLPGWADGLGGATFDAVFTGWVTHEIEPWNLDTFYAEIARMLRPGGVLFNADFMTALSDGWRDLGADYQRRRVGSGFAQFRNRFDRYFPTLIAPVAASASPHQPSEQRTRWNKRHTPMDHLERLQRAGFVDAEEVWRYLGYSMVMAVR